MSYYFPHFQQFLFSKRFSSNNRYKIKDQNHVSSVTMLKHNIIYKRCLVTFNKSCLKRLKLLRPNSQKLFLSILRSYWAYKIQKKILFSSTVVQSSLFNCEYSHSTCYRSILTTEKRQLYYVNKNLTKQIFFLIL